MKRRDLFKIARTSVAAFLVAKYGTPEPACGVWKYHGESVTVRAHEVKQVLWAANTYGLSPAQVEALEKGLVLAG